MASDRLTAVVVFTAKLVAIVVTSVWMIAVLDRKVGLSPDEGKIVTRSVERVLRQVPNSSKILVNGRDEQTQPSPGDCDIDVHGAEDNYEEVLAEIGGDETELADAKNKLAGVNEENEKGGVDDENETEEEDENDPRILFVLGSAVFGAILNILAVKYLPTIYWTRFYRDDRFDDLGVAYGVEYIDVPSEYSADEDSEDEPDERFMDLERARGRGR